MAKWRIVVSRSARKQLFSLDSVVQRRLRDSIDRLPEGDIKKLRGAEDLFRARVGDCRIVFRLNHSDHLIHIVGVFRRDKAYR